MIIKDGQGKDCAVSTKTAVHGKGWSGGVYFRTKTGVWKFNSCEILSAAVDVPKKDINPENKLPWGVNPETITEVSK